MGYPKMDISHWDAAIHYGVQLAQYCDQTLSCNAISPRSPPLCSLALRLRNTKVPVLTHESIGYPKMDISHWDAAIHYGIQLAKIVIKPDLLTLLYRDHPLCIPMPLDSGTPKYMCGLMCPWGTRKWTSAIGTRHSNMAFSLPNVVIKPDLLTLFHGDRLPCVLPCPKTQEHQITCVDLWAHMVPENGHQPLGRGNSLWRSACPILWSNPTLQRCFTEIAPSVLPCPKTQEHQSTCVDSWVHKVPENGHQPLGHCNSLWRSACPILWSNPIV